MSDSTARVLIVDDEENIREVLERGLSRAGYECITAAGTEQASTLLEEEEFDLVLLDITMPGRSGVEFLPEIISQHPDVAVVMLTGIVDVSTGVRAMRDGAYDYVNKPVALPDLIIRAENALSKRALMLENRSYQQKLEQMVDGLNARQEQCKNELTSLNNILGSHINQGVDLLDTFSVLQKALKAFNTEVEGLAELVKIVSQDDKDAPVEYATIQVS